MLVFNFGSNGNGLSVNVKQYNSFPLIDAENTIGVISTTMTDWCLQYDEPQSPATGLVWIKLGTSSTTPTSVSRTKSVMCYPISAKEWNGSAWVPLTAKCWQNGAWREWADVWIASGQYMKLTTNDSGSNATVTQRNGYIECVNPGRQYGYLNNNIRLITSELVDITPLKTIKMRYQILDVNSNYIECYVGLTMSNAHEFNLKDSYVSRVSFRSPVAVSPVEVSLDVSNINQNAYLAITTWHQYASADTVSFNLYDVWGEY